jgi:hypothetical protein
MPHLNDDIDCFGGERDRTILRSNAVVVSLGYGSQYVIPRSDLPTLLDIAARAVRVRPPEVEHSYNHDLEPAADDRGMLTSVEIRTIRRAGTAKAKLEAEAAAAAVAAAAKPVAVVEAAE